MSRYVPVGVPSMTRSRAEVEREERVGWARLEAAQVE